MRGAGAGEGAAMVTTPVVGLSVPSGGAPWVCCFARQ